MAQVLTSQTNTKRNFRKAEVLMREVELFSTLAAIRTGFAYPKEVSLTSAAGSFTS